MKFRCKRASAQVLLPQTLFSKVAERWCSGPPPFHFLPTAEYYVGPFPPDSPSTKFPPRCYITRPGEGHITVNPSQGNWRSRRGVLIGEISVPLEVRILSLLFYLTLHICTGDDIDASVLGRLPRPLALDYRRWPAPIRLHMPLASCAIQDLIWVGGGGQLDVVAEWGFGVLKVEAD